MRVVGIEHSVGKYEGNDYDNMKIHCVRPADPKREESGEITEIIKIKTDLYNCILVAFNSSGYDLKLGVDVNPVYNRYGQVVDLQII